MATFTAIKNRGGGRGALGGVLRYVQQEEKATWEDRRLVSGWNCTAQSVCSEMQLTKERFRKTDGRQYYHFVQSFAETDDLTPQKAHAIALELAQREFPNFEVLVATHIDTDHLHSHLIVNSVSFRDGKKLHQSAADLQAHRTVNDEICAAHGLAILPPPEKQVKQKRMSSREYRSAAKGESWKFRLMNTIDQCMRYASTKEEFRSLMESEGYQVRWTDGRKNITYTTPSGWQCRDRLLFGDKYLKENMEYEFRIRAEIIHGRAVGEEPTRAGGTAYAAVSSTGADTASRSASHENGVGGSAERPLHTGVPHRETDRLSEEDQRTAGAASDPDADGRAAESGEASGEDERTGWEAEREAFFSAQHQTAQTAAAAPGWSHMGGPADGDGSIASAVVGLGYRLEQSQFAAPVMDSTTMRPHTDRKTLRKERRKKIAQGHAEDDHEEEQTWQQTM